MTHFIVLKSIRLYDTFHEYERYERVTYFFHTSQRLHATKLLEKFVLLCPQILKLETFWFLGRYDDMVITYTKIWYKDIHKIRYRFLVCENFKLGQNLSKTILDEYNKSLQINIWKILCHFGLVQLRTYEKKWLTNLIRTSTQTVLNTNKIF